MSSLSYDYVELYNGKTEDRSNRIGRYCGNKVPVLLLLPC